MSQNKYDEFLLELYYAKQKWSAIEVGDVGKAALQPTPVNYKFSVRIFELAEN